MNDKIGGVSLKKLVPRNNSSKIMSAEKEKSVAYILKNNSQSKSHEIGKIPRKSHEIAQEFKYLNDTRTIPLFASLADC